MLNTHLIGEKNVLKLGTMLEKNEITNKYLDEILHNNKIQKELAMQTFSEDQTVGNNTVQDLKELNSQSLVTKAKKGEQLDSMMPAIRKAFDLMGDDIVDLSTQNDAFRK